MATATPTANDQLVSERVAGGILPRVLTSFDMVAIFVAIVEAGSVGPLTDTGTRPSLLYAFWGATQDMWIGPLWPRGRARAGSSRSGGSKPRAASPSTRRIRPLPATTASST